LNDLEIQERIFERSSIWAEARAILQNILLESSNMKRSLRMTIDVLVQTTQGEHDRGRNPEVRKGVDLLKGVKSRNGHIKCPSLQTCSSRSSTPNRWFG
jgi:hypothetical protein